MVTVLVVLALIAGSLFGAYLATALSRPGGPPSPALRHLSGLREQLQTEHAVALASSDTRAALGTAYGWPQTAPIPTQRSKD